MNQNHKQTRRPAPRRNEDPTNTASLPHERDYTREDLDKIFTASVAVLGLETGLRQAYGSVHRIMALARVALVTAGYYAEEAEANGMGPNAAWASARDLRDLVFSLGTPKSQSEQRQG